MDFKDAERVINVCALYQIPLLVCGPNGIGKTEMLKAIQSKMKNTEIFAGIDFGGLTSEGVNDTTDTVFISDLQTILGRKKTTQSTLSAITSLITDYGMDNRMFNGRGFNRKRPLGFIVACTPNHYFHLVKYKYADFLSRFLIIKVDRDQADMSDNKYELHQKLAKKCPKNVKKELKIIKFTSNIRKNLMFSKLFWGLSQSRFFDKTYAINFALPSSNLIISMKDLDKYMGQVSLEMPQSVGTHDKGYSLIE